MTNDLMTRLRAIRPKLKSGEYNGSDIMEAWCAADSAAAEISRLQAEVERLTSVADAEMKLREGNFEMIERLRTALEWVSRLASEDGTICDHRYEKLIRDAADTAREALAPESGEKENT